MVVSYDKLQHQISKLQEIADKRASQVDRENFRKYSHLFDAMEKYLKTKRVLLYGGVAINGLLPKDLRFYGENILPDLDVMCSDGEKLAKDVISHFRRNGFEFSSATEALHPGTFKVFVGGMQLLDITTVSPTAFKRLSKNGVKLESGLKTADPEYLRMTLHILLSQPRDSHRWSKVLERLVAFYTAYPVDKRCKTVFTDTAATATETSVMSALDEGAKWLAARDFVMFGTDAVVEILGLSPKLRAMLPPGRPMMFKGIAPIAALVESTKPEIIAKELAQKMGASLLTIEHFEADNFLPAHARIIHKATKQPLVALYEAPACVSYITYKNTRVASIHTLVRMLMAHDFSNYKHATAAAPLYRCFANVLSVLMLETLTGKKKKLLEQFLIECYGVQPGVVTLRRMRLQRMKK